MNQRLITGIFTAALLCGYLPSASAQTCYFIGERYIKRLWFETSLGLQIFPTQNFDNPANCTVSSSAIVSLNHPMFKQLQASILFAWATGKPINAYGCGCQSAWSDTFPIVTNFGVGSAQ